MTDTMIWKHPTVILHSTLLLRSFERVVGRTILPASGDAAEDARALFDLPAAVLSHGTQADPILNYGNGLALKMFELDFASLTQMPSRLTAQPMLRAERQELLERAARKGFIEDYSGIRISASGRLFRIENFILWTVTDEHGQACGQAAYFDRWTDL